MNCRTVKQNKDSAYNNSKIGFKTLFRFLLLFLGLNFTLLLFSRHLFAAETSISSRTGWPQKMSSFREQSWTATPSHPVIDDLDGNGTKEVIVATQGGEIYIWKDGGSSFSKNWPKQIGPGPLTTPSVGDVDHNGIKEIVVGEEDGGRLKKLHVLDLDGESISAAWPKDIPSRPDIGVRRIMQAPTLYNLDGDEDETLEIITATSDYRLAVFNHLGDLLWAVNVSGNATTAAVGDITGDEIPEIVVATDFVQFSTKQEFGNIYAFDVNGNPIPGIWPVATQGIVQPPVLGDLDGDGVNEIVANAKEGLYVLEGNGETVNASWPKNLNGAFVEPYYKPVALGNLDEDDAPEILVNNVWSSMMFNVDGSVCGFNYGESRYGLTTPSSAGIIFDRDGDSLPEILVNGAATDVLIQINTVDNGKELFLLNPRQRACGGYLETGSGYSAQISYWSLPAVGDLDGNGSLEMAAFGTFNDRKFHVFDLAGQHNSLTMEWPMFHHDPQHTGTYASQPLVLHAPSEVKVYKGEEQIHRISAQASGNGSITVELGTHPDWIELIPDQSKIYPGHYEADIRFNPPATESERNLQIFITARDGVNQLTQSLLISIDSREKIPYFFGLPEKVQGVENQQLLLEVEVRDANRETELGLAAFIQQDGNTVVEPVANLISGPNYVDLDQDGELDYTQTIYQVEWHSPEKGIFNLHLKANDDLHTIEQNVPLEVIGPLTLTNAVSRKTHGSSGVYDLRLPFDKKVIYAGESRMGNILELLLKFDAPLSEDSVRIETAPGTIEGSPVINDDGVTVRIKNIPEASSFTLLLADQAGFSSILEISLLPGDVNGDCVVNLVDLSMIRANLFQPLTENNFRFDMNADGVINIVDLSETKTRLGKTLTKCQVQ